MDYFDILLAKKLNGGGGGDITVESLSVSENGTYTAPSGKAYSPVNVEVPLPSNAIYKQTLSNLPSPIATFTGADAPIDSLKASIVGVQDLHGYDSPWAGGAGKNKLPMTVDDIKTANTSGTWSGNDYTNNGMVYTLLTDSSNNVIGIKANGTSTVNYPNLYLPDMPIKTGTYTLSGAPVGSDYVIYFNSGTQIINGETKTFDVASDYTQTKIRLCVTNKATANNIIFYPQIELGSTATSFAPYSNICPISGWSSCEVNKTGKNMLDETAGVAGFFKSDGSIQSSQAWKYQYIKVNPNTNYTISNIPASVPAVYLCWFDGNKNFISNSGSHDNGTITSPNNAVYLGFCINQNSELGVNIQIEAGNQATTYEPYNGNTYTIPFKDSSDNPITVYGGGIDISGGKLTVTHANIASYNGETINEPWISSEDAYTQGATPTTGAQVVYPLTTPLIYDFDPLAIRSDGVTNISVNCGEVTELKYFSETP